MVKYSLQGHEKQKSTQAAVACKSYLMIGGIRLYLHEGCVGLRVVRVKSTEYFKTFNSLLSHVFTATDLRDSRALFLSFHLC